MEVAPIMIHYILGFLISGFLCFAFVLRVFDVLTRSWRIFPVWMARVSILAGIVGGVAGSWYLAPWLASFG